MPLITCEDINISYEHHTVVSDMNFSIDSGDYLCIVGENGSGKSTLIKAILSLKSVDGGRLIFGDGLSQNEIGYMPQQSSAQKDFPANVREIVLSGCLHNLGMRPFYSKTDKKLALENMEKLGITQLASKSYRELSGGQQQRVFLARALCATKKLLLLDEPVSGLDPVVTGELYDIIEKLNKDGITIIMVSHDLLSAVKYASHILHIKNRPVFFGTTEDYIVSDTGRRFFGGRTNA